MSIDGLKQNGCHQSKEKNWTEEEKEKLIIHYLGNNNRKIPSNFKTNRKNIWHKSRVCTEDEQEQQQQQKSIDNKKEEEKMDEKNWNIWNMDTRLIGCTKTTNLEDLINDLTF